MMTINHTLAPWKAPASQFGYVTAIDNYGNPITVCSARSEADARLIAAAPDMLSLLWSIKSHLYSGASLHAGAQLFDDDMPILSAIDHVLDQATKGRTA